MSIVCLTDDPRELELREAIIGNANVFGMTPPKPTRDIAWDGMTSAMHELNQFLIDAKEKAYREAVDKYDEIELLYSDRQIEAFIELAYIYRLRDQYDHWRALKKFNKLMSVKTVYVG